MKTKKEGILTVKSFNGKKMTRKQAICKAGFIAISAATTMMLLVGPLKGHATSAPAAPVSEPSGGTWTKRT